MDTTSYIKTINEYKKSIDTQILQIRADRLFAFLINEREMKTIEWLMSKILDIKISEVEGKIIVKNSRIPIRNKKERRKFK